MAHYSLSQPIHYYIAIRTMQLCQQHYTTKRREAAVTEAVQKQPFQSQHMYTIQTRPTAQSAAPQEIAAM